MKKLIHRIVGPVIFCGWFALTILHNAVTPEIPESEPNDFNY